MTSNVSLRHVEFGVQSDVVKDTVSAIVKFASEIDESSSRDIGQLTG